MIKEHGKNVADMIMVASAGAAGTSILADIDHVVSIVAGVAAIIAACISAYMHITRRKKRRKDEQV